MATSTPRRRPGRGMHGKDDPAQQNPGRKVRKLPEFLEPAEAKALIACAATPKATLCMMIQWRAGLRISEAVALEAGDFQFGTDKPTLRVRRGKGHKARIVPVHQELVEAVEAMLQWSGIKTGPLIGVSREGAWRWVKQAYLRAIESGTLPEGRRIATHTLRHSAARHWLANGVAINVVQRWLGHASLQTTLRYLEILPDPAGDMARVP